MKKTILAGAAVLTGLAADAQNSFVTEQRITTGSPIKNEAGFPFSVEFTFGRKDSTGAREDVLLAGFSGRRLTQGPEFVVAKEMNKGFNAFGGLAVATQEQRVEGFVTAWPLPLTDETTKKPTPVVMAGLGKKIFDVDLLPELEAMSVGISGDARLGGFYAVGADKPGTESDELDLSIGGISQGEETAEPAPVGNVGGFANFALQAEIMTKPETGKPSLGAALGAGFTFMGSNTGFGSRLAGTVGFIYKF